jgi:hypothetical protein
VDDPRGARAVGSKRIFKIDISDATDISARTTPLPGGDLPTDITPVAKSGVFLDITANSLLPNGKQAEKWEGLGIGPAFANGDRLILTGNDNDYSVTQTGAGEQFDVYVNFAGSFARCVLDDPTQCEVDPATDDLVIDNPVALPAGYSLLPGMLHAYRVSPADLGRYVKPHAPVKKPQ